MENITKMCFLFKTLRISFYHKLRVRPWLLLYIFNIRGFNVKPFFSKPTVTKCASIFCQAAAIPTVTTVSDFFLFNEGERNISFLHSHQ